MKTLNWTIIFIMTIFLIICNFMFLYWLRTDNNNNNKDNKIINDNLPINENIKVDENMIVNEKYEDDKNNIILKNKENKKEKKIFKFHEVNFKYLETGVNHSLFRGNFDINEYDFSLKNILGILLILIFIAVFATLIEIKHIKNKKINDDVIENDNYIIMN